MNLSVAELEALGAGCHVQDVLGQSWEKRYLSASTFTLNDFRSSGEWWVHNDVLIRNSYTLDRDWGPIKLPPVDMSPLSDLYLESYNIPVDDEPTLDELIVEEMAKVAEKTFYVDPVTGGKKEVKQAQLGAIDPSSLIELAKVAGDGAAKYETYNYLLGYPWSLNFNSAQRHLLAFWSGENIDSESGHPHLAHAAWHCLALLSFMNHDLGTDDRWVPPEASDV